MNHVIIGNGVAGIQAAEAVRRSDPAGSITLIGDETFPPYCRPMISLVLEGKIKPEKLPIRSASFYDDLNITPVLGKRVTGIDAENRKVLIRSKTSGDSLSSAMLTGHVCEVLNAIRDDAEAESRTEIAFDRLLIASGADPRPVKAEGLNLKNIFFMRTEHHVRQMSDVLPEVKNALVLGGGLVGFKAAYGLLRRSISVTMLIRSDYPLSMQADETAGSMILDELLKQGLKVRSGVEATAFEGPGNVRHAYLSDGTAIPCDMVVVGKGVTPAISFVPRDKIRTDLGIRVNEYMETSVPGIFAAGDVAETLDIARNTPWVNAIWPEAAAQGRIAGMNMAGRAVAYRGSLSRNVIRIFGLDVMTGGVVNPSPKQKTDESVYETFSMGDPRRKTYRKLVFRDDKLAGMVMVNDIEQGGVLLSLIQNQRTISIPKAAMLEPSFNYRQLMG
jgi:NAD(P)H-nitrite reductase large subunit